MRRLALVFLAVFVAPGVMGVVSAEAGAESASYSQVVDNATEGRFKADEGWGTSSYGRGVHNENYRFVRPAQDDSLAEFKVKIPHSAEYALYARWPQVKGLNDSAAVGVVTSSGVEWRRVNQRKDGGRWVRIGVYSMEAGDDYSVMFSRQTRGEGYVIADAVKVERVSPPAGSSSSSSSSRASKSGSGGSSSGRTGQDVVREAKKWSGVRYRLGGVSRSGVDCSGLTMQVYKKFGVSLPHSDNAQYRYGRKVSGPLKPGDLVFFDEHGRGISHVGIYSGNGKLIHASNYFNKVTESEMKYIKGYVGARRLL